MQNFFQPKKSSKIDTAGKSEKVEAQQKSLPWVEKYRPRGLDAVCAQEEAVSMLKKALRYDYWKYLYF